MHLTYEDLPYPHPNDINGSTVGTPYSSLKSQFYATTQSATLAAMDARATVICYTIGTTTPVTNGSGTDCTTGTKYTTALTVSSTEQLNAVAGGNGLTDSPVSFYNFQIGASAGGPAPAPAPFFTKSIEAQKSTTVIGQ
jgi:hypothetical protein